MGFLVIKLSLIKRNVRKDVGKQLEFVPITLHLRIIFKLRQILSPFIHNKVSVSDNYIMKPCSAQEE